MNCRLPRHRDLGASDDPQPGSSLRVDVVCGVVCGGGLAVVVVVVVVVVPVVVGAVVVVVGAGEAAACAGTITDFTTGFTQRSGNTSALAALPPSAVCKIRRRSVVIVKSPLRRKKTTHFAGRKQPLAERPGPLGKPCTELKRNSVTPGSDSFPLPSTRHFGVERAARCCVIGRSRAFGRHAVWLILVDNPQAAFEAPQDKVADRIFFADRLSVSIDRTAVAAADREELIGRTVTIDLTILRSGRDADPGRRRSGDQLPLALLRCDVTSERNVSNLQFAGVAISLLG
jgi:hypothetical protein